MSATIELEQTCPVVGYVKGALERSEVNQPIAWLNDTILIGNGMKLSSCNLRHRQVTASTVASTNSEKYNKKLAPIKCIAASPDMGVIIGLNDGKSILYDMETGKVKRVMGPSVYNPGDDMDMIKEPSVTGMDFNEATSSISIGYENGVVVNWDTRTDTNTWQYVNRLEGEGGNIKWNTNGTKLAVKVNGFEVDIVDTGTLVSQRITFDKEIHASKYAVKDRGVGILSTMRRNPYMGGSFDWHPSRENMLASTSKCTNIYGGNVIFVDSTTMTTVGQTNNQYASDFRWTNKKDKFISLEKKDGFYFHRGWMSISDEGLSTMKIEYGNESMDLARKGKVVVGSAMNRSRSHMAILYLDGVIESYGL